jgi:LmbE family N-acetylglucosaminyl deacetylase
MKHGDSSQAFNPADPGTPEEEWLRLLAGAEEWAPRPGPLVVAAPHPDDEVLGAGGLIQSWVASGQAVTILSVTDGEASDPGRHGLDLVRRKELREALRILTPGHVTIERLGIPDGKVRDHANRLRQVLEEYATADATFIAPYEHDGHPDHDVVGRVCTDVAGVAGIAVARYPVWIWHHTDPRAVRSLHWARFSLTGVAQRAKARAVQCFESQLRPASGSPIVPRHVLKYFQRPFESFVL